MVTGRTAGQYRGTPAALSAVYPLVREASRTIPAESRLRSIIERFPSEDVLRDHIDTRNASVHNYAKVVYVDEGEVAEAAAGATAFWAAAVVVLGSVQDLQQIASNLEDLI